MKLIAIQILQMIRKQKALKEIDDFENKALINIENARTKMTFQMH